MTPSSQRCSMATRPSFKEWETSTPYFDGCLPIEVMAERGRETLRHGPMKPFGLTNPHNSEVKPYAVVQLRQDNKLGTLFNMVGFQTKLKYGEQVRVFRTIPGPGECRVRAARRPSPQHLPQLAETAGRDIAAEGQPAPALCRTDHRLRRLCGMRRHRPDRRPLCRGRAARRAIALPPPTTAHGALIKPHHRRPYRDHRCRAVVLPADECQFRPVSADGGGAGLRPQEQAWPLDGESACAQECTHRARARRFRSLDRQRRGSCRRVTSRPEPFERFAARQSRDWRRQPATRAAETVDMLCRSIALYHLQGRQRQKCRP